jgi:hypothetical protein
MQEYCYKFCASFVWGESNFYIKRLYFQFFDAEFFLLALQKNRKDFLFADVLLFNGKSPII